jgi:hypothetical protein
MNDPALGIDSVGRGADLELEAAIGALHRRTAPAHERVVELVLGLTPLALDVHREAFGGLYATRLREPDPTIRPRSGRIP